MAIDLSFSRQGDRSLLNLKTLSGSYEPVSSKKMGYVRLRIRELAEAKGWTLKEVADQSGVNYNTVKGYVKRDALNTVDLSAVFKIARAFGVAIEDLVEVLEE